MGFCFFNSSFSSAQDFTLEALVPTTFNEHGDPQINKVDANGARQGDWFYNDHSNVLCVKEQYQDHNLVNSLIQVGTNEAPVWVNFNDFITSNSLINQASNYLNSPTNELPSNFKIVLA